MFRINKDIEYGLMALRAMDEDMRIFSARELSDRLRIPSGILSKILQRLCHAGLVTSVQGKNGGYRLARSGDEITVGAVVDAVHGPERLVACMEEPGSCEQLEICTIRHSFEAVQGMWVGFLNSLTLKRFAEIYRSGEAAGTPAEQEA